MTRGFVLLDKAMSHCTIQDGYGDIISSGCDLIVTTFNSGDSFLNCGSHCRAAACIVFPSRLSLSSSFSRLWRIGHGWTSLRMLPENKVRYYADTPAVCQSKLHAKKPHQIPVK